MPLASDQRNREHVDSVCQRSMVHFGSLMAQTAAASEQRMRRLADDFDALRQQPRGSWWLLRVGHLAVGRPLLTPHAFPPVPLLPAASSTAVVTAGTAGAAGEAAAALQS
jgi:hypothetical protein